MERGEGHIQITHYLMALPKYTKSRRFKGNVYRRACEDFALVYQPDDFTLNRQLVNCRDCKSTF